MKKIGFLLFAVAVALSISMVEKATATKSFPQCKRAPDDLCLTGPGANGVLVDFQNYNP